MLSKMPMRSALMGICHGSFAISRTSRRVLENESCVHGPADPRARVPLEISPSRASARRSDFGANLFAGPAFHSLSSGMKTFLTHISADPQIMGGESCIRGTRVTVGTIVGQLGSGVARERLLEMYPYISSEAIDACLQYAAWRSEEIEVPFDRLTA
jgi:uncharacterized protein (DUF433 family)